MCFPFSKRQEPVRSETTEGSLLNLSEFIGYVDLAEFRKISPKPSRDNDKQNYVGKFWYSKYFSRGVHLRNTSCILLATPTLDADIETTGQNIEKAWHTSADWCLNDTGEGGK